MSDRDHFATADLNLVSIRAGITALDSGKPERRMECEDVY
jgi:hypothetical protein